MSNVEYPTIQSFLAPANLTSDEFKRVRSRLRNSQELMKTHERNARWYATPNVVEYMTNDKTCARFIARRNDAIAKAKRK